MSRKVLVTAKVHPYLIEQLEGKGFEVSYQPAVTYDEVKSAIKDFVGLIVTTRIRVDKQIIDQATMLQWIGRLGSGMELIDVPYAESKGIHCASSPEGNRDAVGEQAVGMLLCLLNNVLKSNLELRAGVWERDGNRGYELNGKTVGIIGYGNTGSTFARKLQGFDVNILAYDKYKEGFGTAAVKEATLEQVFRESDVVSIHLPLTEETRHMADMAFFKSFARPVWFMNTARGKLVNNSDLIAALENGVVAGACLDVLENEKMSTYSATEQEQLAYFLQASNVVVTPHIAGYSHEASIKMARIVLEKLNII
ncbi:NAD(P)-dependent oxidoreductase [Chitinophaga nivalis]|uniref:Hydroxyacid dehydrogenase n=1 Tax=Chitinophaga nivalis TaxID=2991709 RepID=A0ABT3IWR8_9BACT|nr:NAD(P)-dependent oxidoreductase [Chitinophaga nivalis]MCW3461904.1 hydroxyacid dehydrogenase [Chitinophaga nivalis]MCW3488405.1 hydroxyacid dehydrogenase [Chitinophaga nivalis]